MSLQKFRKERLLVTSLKHNNDKPIYISAPHTTTLDLWQQQQEAGIYWKVDVKMFSGYQGSNYC